MGETSENSTLSSALRQTVTAVGAPIGMVYLFDGPGGPDGSLRLHPALTSGNPEGLSLGRQEVDALTEAATAQAIRERAVVWLPASPDRTSTPYTGPRTGTDTGPYTAPYTGVAAVPLCHEEDTLGVLSVVTSRPGPPTDAERGLLEVAARWIAGLVADLVDSGSAARPAASPLRAAREAVRVGAWDWNIRTGDILWDEEMALVLGIPPDHFDGRIETWRALVHPEDLPAVVTQAEQSLRKGGEYGVRHRVLRPDGTVGWVEARGRIVNGDDGRPARMVGRLWETSETRAAMDSVGRALQHMSDGFLAVDSDGRIMYVNGRAQQLVGPSDDLIGRVLWELPAVAVPALASRCRSAMADRVATGIDVRSPTDGRSYHLRIIPVPDGLTVYLTDVTEQREIQARRAAEERAAAERTSRIGGLTRALAEALTVQDVINAVAERLLPLVGATGLIVHAAGPGGDWTLQSVGYPRSYIDRLPDGPENNPLDQAMRDGVPRFVDSPQELEARYPGLAAFAALGGKHSWAFLPLMVSGRVVGGCVISFDRPRRLADDERGLLIALSGLIAQTLERARLYDAEHHRAQELQRGLLPRALPLLPTVTTAARYLPASEGMLGGDWYDVIPLSGDRVALVIGDVMGHGLSEAATMGRLRTAVHTLAGLELPPDELFSHLNDLVSDLGDDFYATCLYAVYDPATGSCAVSSAGHPPPVLVSPDGTVRLLDLAADPPLGAATPPFETTELVLPEGSLLVLYTDGFVESARRDIDTGIVQLTTALTTTADTAPPTPATGPWPRPDEREQEQTDEAGRLDRLCASLTAALLPEGEQTGDDAAVLVARVRALRPEDMSVWTLPEDPVAAGQARSHIRRRLAEWQLDELVTTTELLASELVGNVVRHARGPLRLRLVRSRSLICEVSDGSLTTPRMRRARDTDEGGRGLQLVAALSQRWGVRYTLDGKCIWTEQPLPDPVPAHTTGAAQT
ncbi:SpoIIE family protein phosphatase [Streptomyces sp. NBC_00878]|uniref:SpoIIE family protein phosphatase n=1 Tax=Streptomyces sp. NBC_00878 TaxID=2975854 RepID=UPI00224F02E5|nr:SpoIIE family protein phosphatase [Streptomyces sp. NBC_00878]MCX4907447.1 SpoIIE family protein phosphatase [Streptomyces sp. NBC_00878]